ncbi:hypothetical protein [Aestuariivita sp.]|jgi:hypothetical protein|uniref:hypothetical protein n=1 Tax=Aestuariivita sp. TaxID=1872407 RepID=UPI00216F0EBE|nr:hypothetical protein [Aestuariivita sp.]MCE8009409.1 hypothetical protein [Aestuariivita sp.]
MRDDRLKWDAPASDPKVLAQDGLHVTRVRPTRLTLISGVQARRASALPLIGWPDQVTSEQFALCLRRDRILEVGGPDRLPGWDAEAGLAISEMTDGYAMFHLDGDRTLGLLKRGGVARPDQPSPSVVRLMFGMDVLLYCRGASGFGLCVPGPRAETLRSALRAHLSQHGAEI